MITAIFIWHVIYDGESLDPSTKGEQEREEGRGDTRLETGGRGIETGSHTGVGTVSEATKEALVSRVDGT